MTSSLDTTTTTTTTTAPLGDQRPLCVLDIDETLVSSYFSVEDGLLVLPRQPQVPTPVRLPSGTTFAVYVRPHAHEFLARLAPHYRLALWSAGRREYVYAIAEQLFTATAFTFVWTADECLHGLIYRAASPLTATVFKPLAHIPNATLNKTVVVDDNPLTASKNSANLILMPPFEHTRCADTDHCLPLLGDFLLSIKDVDDMRLHTKYWLELRDDENTTPPLPQSPPPPPTADNRDEK